MKQNMQRIYLIAKFIWYFSIIISVIASPILIRNFFHLGDINEQMPLGNIYFILFMTVLWLFSVVPVLTIIYQIKEISRSLAENKPFKHENSKRLKIIGYAMFCFGLLLILFELYSSITTYLLYQASNIRVDMWQKLTLTIQSPLAYVLLFFIVGWVLIILAHILDRAVIIKKENDLTI